MCTLGRIGEIDDAAVDRLLQVLGSLVERDQTRDWTDTSAENLARILRQLRPAQFPVSVLDPNRNHLRNPAAFLASRLT